MGDSMRRIHRRSLLCLGLLGGVFTLSGCGGEGEGTVKVESKRAGKNRLEALQTKAEELKSKAKTKNNKQR
jgi:hypothetical protein